MYLYITQYCTYQQLMLGPRSGTMNVEVQWQTVHTVNLTFVSEALEALWDLFLTGGSLTLVRDLWLFGPYLSSPSALNTWDIKNCCWFQLWDDNFSFTSLPILKSYRTFTCYIGNNRVLWHEYGWCTNSSSVCDSRLLCHWLRRTRDELRLGCSGSLG